MAAGSPYSWISVKVGLETSSALAAPRPSAMPCVSVVFPAPRSPISSTTPRSGSCFAKSLPNARVSSPECVSKRRTNFIHRLRKRVQQVESEHRLFAPPLAGQFSAAAVQPNRRDYRFLPIIGILFGRILRQQSGNHSCEDVTRATRCHRRRTGGIHPRFAICERDHSPVAFENNDRAALFCKLLRDPEPIGLNFLCGFPDQAAHFAGMRCEDSNLIRFRQAAGQSVQGIGIHHGGRVRRLVYMLYETNRLVLGPEPRPD